MHCALCILDWMIVCLLPDFRYINSDFSLNNWKRCARWRSHLRWVSSTKLFSMGLKPNPATPQHLLQLYGYDCLDGGVAAAASPQSVCCRRLLFRSFVPSFLLSFFSPFMGASCCDPPLLYTPAADPPNTESLLPLVSVIC